LEIAPEGVDVVPNRGNYSEATDDNSTIGNHLESG
jgi:hypothetical protein